MKKISEIEKQPNTKTLNAIEAFFKEMREKSVIQWHTHAITTNNALYYLIRKDPALRDQENNIKRELIQTLGQQIFPETNLVTENFKTKKVFQNFLQDKIAKGIKEYSPHDFELYNPGRYQKIIKIDGYKNPDSGQTLWDKIHADFSGDYKDKISIKFNKKAIYSEKFIRQQLNLFFDHLKKEGVDTWSPKDLQEFNVSIYSYIRRSGKEVGQNFREEINNKYGGKEKNLKVKYYYNTDVDIDNFFALIKQRSAKYRTSRDIELSNPNLYNKLLRDKSLRDENNQVNRKLLNIYSENKIQHATDAEVAEIKLREAFLNVCKSLWKKQSKSISPIELRRKFAYFYLRIQESQKYKPKEDGMLDWNGIFQELINLYGLSQKYKNINIEKEKKRTQEFIKKRLEDFFIYKERYTWKPTDIQKYDEILYLMLTRKYRYNQKVDRFYIIIHLTTDPEKNILSFRHQKVDEFRTKAKYSSYTQSSNLVDYKLQSPGLSPEEEFISSEEKSIYEQKKQILQNAINKLDTDEKLIIQNFYDEIQVDTTDLEKIIQKLKNIINPEI